MQLTDTHVVTGMAPPRDAATLSKSKAKATTGVSEADIVTNKALLFHAEAARLAKSWLRGGTTTGSGGGQDEADGDDDDDGKGEEDFEKEFLRNKDMYSETGGVGYHPAPESPSSTSTPGVTDPTTDFLKKHLLRSHHHRRRATNGNAYTHNATNARPRPQLQASRRGKGEEDSDEEESRSGVGKSKNKAGNMRAPAARDPTKGARQIDQAENGRLSGDSGAGSCLHELHAAAGGPGHADPDPEPSVLHVPRPKTSKKRGTGSYLDELLASRAAKKQKKKTKEKNLAETEPG